MKVVTFQDPEAPDAGPRIGVVRDADGTIVDLDRAHSLVGDPVGETPSAVFADMLSLLRAGAAGMAAARRLAEWPPERALVPLSSARLLAPVPRPNTIRDFMAFEGHTLNSLRTMARLKGQDPEAVRVPEVWYRFPAYYKGNPMTVVGPEAEVIWPSYELKLDYELEFGCFIGKAGKDIPADRVGDYVWGITLLNDWSIRDGMRVGKPLSYAQAKNFDHSTSMGPCIVVGELKPQDVHVETRVNGAVRQHYNTRDMIWSFGEVLEMLSQDFTFVPGDVISGGTAAGTAADKTPPGPDGTKSQELFLKPGDVVEVSSPKIGLLSNRIV